MDLANFAFCDEYVMPVLHPVTGEPVDTDDGTPMTVTVYGADSQHYAKAMAEAMQDGPKETRAVRIAAGCTKEWTIQHGGKTPPVKDAAKVYGEAPWLQNRVFEAIHSRATFFSDASQT